MPPTLEDLSMSQLRGRLKVAFGYPEHGWVTLALLATPYNQSLVIYLSHVFDPFGEIRAWLVRIAAGDLPAELKIDEEGTCKYLTASDAEEPKECEFRVQHEDGRTLMRCCLQRHALLDDFSTALRTWLTDQYNPAAFNAPWDPRTLLNELPIRMKKK